VSTSDQIKEAINTLTTAMKEDVELGSYAHGWFCNIKMPIYDELCDYEKYLDGVLNKTDFDRIAAKAANNLMSHLFQVPTDFE
jgi:hypothetical protein